MKRVMEVTRDTFSILEIKESVIIIGMHASITEHTNGFKSMMQYRLLKKIYIGSKARFE